MKFDKTRSFRFCISVILLSMVLAYVIGGICFYFNDSKYVLFENIYKSIAVLMVVAFTVSFVFVFLAFKNSKICEALNNSYESLRFKNWKNDFISFYNINKTDIIILIVCIVAGLILRLIGYDWGLVASWQADECKLVDPAIRMADSKILYSDYVYYPDQFVSKIVAVILFFVSKLKGISLDCSTMAEAYFVFRIVVAIFGTATVYTIFLIGNRLKKHLGSICCIVAAVYPYYLSLAKQVTGDVTALFFLSLTILFSLRYIDCRKNSYLILMTMGAAMATLEKWHGAVGIGYVGILLMFCNEGFKDFIKKGFQAVLYYIIWLFVLTPNIWVNPVKTIVDGFINIAVYDGAEGSSYGTLLLNYIKYGVLNFGGIVYLIVFIIGVLFVIKNISKEYYILSMGVLKTLILCLLNRQYSRWGMELYFTEIIILSAGIYMLLFSSKKMIKACGYPITFILLADLLSASILVTVVADIGEKDDRLVQRKECIERGITPENMISQYYTGFGPSSWCDKEYPGTVIRVKDWSEYFAIENDDVYRTEKQTDYVCLNLSRYDIDRDLADLLEKNCTKELEYKAVAKDTFCIPFEETKTSFNDIKVIIQNIKLIADINKGGYVGEDMVVYYVGNLEQVK